MTLFLLLAFGALAALIFPRENCCKLADAVKIKYD